MNKPQGTAPAARRRAVRGIRLLLVLAAAACGAADAPAPAAGGGEAAATDTAATAAADTASMSAALRPFRADTAEPLARHAATVTRPRPDRLVIAARDGGSRAFDDEIVDGEPRRVHLFRGHVDGVDAYVVEVVYVPEGGQFLLVDARTGSVTEVDAPPVASPDGERFVTASLDLVAGHRPNRIRIYRRQADGFVVEWEHAPRDWGAREPRWLDARALSMQRVEVDWSTRPLGERTSELRLALAPGGWTIERR